MRGTPYYSEWLKGTLAADGDACPYPITQIGRRCAWLAGYHDTRREGFA